MKQLLSRLSGLAMVFCVPLFAIAEEPDLKAIVKAADDATKAVKAVAYEAEFFASGAIKDQLPHIKGKVKVKKPKSSMLNSILSGGGFPFRGEGKVQPPGSDEEKSFKVATDGQIVYAIDDAAKTLTKADYEEGRRLLRSAMPLLMTEYIHPTPFTDELNGKRSYEGKQKVGEEECHVIYVKYQQGVEARWYFSVNDHLPRRVDRIVNREGAKGEQTTILTNLEVDPTFKKSTWRLKAPEGYKEKELSEDDEEEEPPFLAVGTKAPDFELETPDGEKVSLKSLRGKVVMIDFWATWCGPCKAAMPGIQKLHEQFKDQPVKIYGVNCWERGGDPVAFMKSKKYTYGLLLKGDKVAEKYNVRGIPTFYVIDPAGKIIYAGGFRPGHEKELAKVIEKAIKDSDT